MLPKFQQFIQERQYLHNVSPATLEWYKHAFKWLRTESPDQAELKDAVLRMRERGLKATGSNSAIRAINAYLKWTESPLKIQQLKEPHLILPTFSVPDIQKLAAWKPKGFYQVRLHVFVLALIDTGCRNSEAIDLRWVDVDFDNLLMKLQGKGSKERLVPFSFELRRHLFQWRKRNRWDLVFPGRKGQRLGRRNMLRDVKWVCKRLGIVPPARTIHAFRHTFAVNYLRKGGSVFHLQKVLGHSTLEMTRRYANLMTEDLQAVHEKISLLSR